MARRHLNRERGAHTLQRTALVHEAFLRMVDQTQVDWQSRSQFFGIASQMMRECSSTTRAGAARRSAARTRRASILTRSLPPRMRLARDLQRIEVDFEAVHQALERLEALDPDQGRLVELRFFGGLSIQEAAEIMRNLPGDGQARMGRRARVSPARAEGRATAMTPERWQRVKELFTAASEFDAAAAAAVPRCRLRRRRRSCAPKSIRLLGAHTADEAIVDRARCASGCRAEFVQEGEHRWIGRRIGPYEITALIGTRRHGRGLPGTARRRRVREGSRDQARAAAAFTRATCCNASGRNARSSRASTIPTSHA